MSTIDLDALSQPAGSPLTRVEETVNAIREDIISGALIPNTKLAVEHLRQRYGVGSSTIREALSLLLPDGLVTARGQRGFTVSPISIADLQDLSNTRILLETHALRESIIAGDDDWEAGVVAAFHRLAKAQEAARQTGRGRSGRVGDPQPAVPRRHHCRQRFAMGATHAEHPPPPHPAIPADGAHRPQRAPRCARRASRAHGGRTRPRRRHCLRRRRDAHPTHDRRARPSPSRRCRHQVTRPWQTSPTHPRLTFQGAQRLIEAARRHAESIGVAVVIHVCDPAGDPLAMARLDGSPKFSITVAAKKAWTAAAAGAPTGPLGAAFLADPVLLHGVAANVDDLIPVGGGVPVLVDGAVAGAIGVSGATEQQDHEIATAAVAALRT